MSRGGAELQQAPTWRDAWSIADLAAWSGLSRVHVVAWRDVDDPGAGGSEAYVASVLERWGAAGIDLTLRTTRVAGGPTHLSRGRVQVVRRGGPATAWMTTPVAEALRRAGPREAIVEVWHGINFLSPLWARGPHLAIVHHVAHEARFLLPRPAARVTELHERRLSPVLYQRTPLVTLSASGKAELVALGHPAANVTVVPPGVHERFGPGGARSARPMILSVGRLVPQKRVDLIIEATAALATRHPGLRLVIVGDGPDRHRLEARARALGVEAELCGHVSDEVLVDLYRSAWVLASASVAEGWNLTVSEAGACGTPAVVSDIPGHRDAVVHGESGLRAADGATLTAAIDQVLADPGTRRTLGLGAMAHAARLSWDETARASFAVLAGAAVRRSVHRQRLAERRPAVRGTPVASSDDLLAAGTHPLDADDVGARPAVNDAVAALLRAGRLRRVSVFANASGTDEAAGLLRGHPDVGVSLHFSVTFGRPLAPPALLPGLVGPAGTFSNRNQVLVRALVGRLPVASVRRELEAQLDRLAELGLNVTGVDAHDNLHAFSPIAEVVADVAAARGIPLVRGFRAMRTATAAGRAKKAALALLAQLSHCVAHRRPGLPPSWHSRGEQPYLLATWERVDPAASNGAVIVCHPGAPCDRLVRAPARKAGRSTPTPARTLAFTLPVRRGAPRRRGLAGRAP